MKPILTMQLKIIFFLVALTLGLLAALHTSALASYAEPSGPGPGPGADGGGPQRGEFLRERREDFRQRREERFGGREGRGPDGDRGPSEGRGERLGERLGGGNRAARYLEMVQNYQTAVQDPHQAVGLAILGLKDGYRRQGNTAGAVKELETFLETTHDQKMRNMFLFGIRQIYEEDHNAEKTTDINKRIIQENLK